MSLAHSMVSEGFGITPYRTRVMQGFQSCSSSSETILRQSLKEGSGRETEVLKSIGVVVMGLSLDTSFCTGRDG